MKCEKDNRLSDVYFERGATANLVQVNKQDPKQLLKQSSDCGIT